MIKVLWNQCECEVERNEPNYNLQAAGYFGPQVRKVTGQCDAVGAERTFTDGHVAIMCDHHWKKCIAIVDKDAVKHVKASDGNP